jgi:replicative DNA helicase
VDDEMRDLSDFWEAMPQDFRVPMELPKALEAEQAALGALLLDPRQLDRVKLAPEDMYLDRHRWLLQALLALRENATVQTVLAWFEERGLDQRLGVGISYLTGLDLHLRSISDLPALAGLIREKAIRRRCIELMMRTARAATSDTRPVNAIMGETLAGLRSLSTAGGAGGFRQLGEALQELIAELEDRESKPREPGLTLGIPEVDEITGGMERKRNWLIAARPGMGKTSALLQLAAREALDDGRHVAFFSLEMDEKELALRVAGQRLGMDTRRVKRASLTRQEWTDLIVCARQILAAGTFHVDQQARIDIGTIEMRVYELASRVPLAAVFVDFLTLVEGDEGEGYEKVVAIARRLAALFKTADVKGCVAGQLKRPEKGGANKRPHLEDIRLGGEESADGVMFLHREICSQGEEEWISPATEFIIPKNRYGPTGKATGRFHGPTQRFLPEIP